MKKFSLLFLIVVIICFTSCATNNNARIIDTLDNHTTNYDFTKTVPARTQSCIDYDAGEAMLTEPYENDSEMFSIDGISVIEGTVSNSESYVEPVITLVYTKSTVKVEKSYKGNIAIGDTITVREFGGFIPSNVLSDAVSIEKFGKVSNSNNTQLLDVRLYGNKVMEKGERVILFLTKPADFYEPVRLWQGKLLFNEEYKVFMPYIPKEESSIINGTAYSAEEFEEFATNCLNK